MFVYIFSSNAEPNQIKWKRVYICCCFFFFFFASHSCELTQICRLMLVICGWMHRSFLFDRLIDHISLEFFNIYLKRSVIPLKPSSVIIIILVASSFWTVYLIMFTWFFHRIRLTRSVLIIFIEYATVKTQNNSRTKWRKIWWSEKKKRKKNNNINRNTSHTSKTDMQNSQSDSFKKQK